MRNLLFLGYIINSDMAQLSILTSCCSTEIYILPIVYGECTETGKTQYFVTTKYNRYNAGELSGQFFRIFLFFCDLLLLYLA